ncbi:Asparagine synthetase [glutamine-hydrolyzing] 1 [uncultured Ruminococcus sp.]|uniref:asparagine synthase (glutamine-hydrolyzing) n=1 Tax=Massiliimalia timonensis TaxID=1987501 RepID=UPI0008231858|nr:asparagine synthase (glutamine-hydrolyzing) [Massiliimalia timonensis]MBS7174670.1 asparagine synthase (glutamine-hydrolyzing) [Clostridiales bacterium]SCH10651.1 Asparagine synthetase [glutamine-hydrolyzing] 1 [uncultured Clostridium sp.]SCI50277.1 Asparagine synthetase [glutamine-hydrolyzing] 1 [uncultured Ruminococcus sp.]
MCGFVGFVDARTQDKANVIHAMADQIVHRGPDQEGYFLDDTAALGFRRLSIIDLEKGGQPIYNEDQSKVLVFNGEIYNYKQLREELIQKGHQFTTKSDSEVLLHGYEEYGKELLQKLRGMYAFVIWDRTSQKLFGARDIFGIKPFYYYHKGDVFLFGSEIKGFLPHPHFEKAVNQKRLPEYLSFEYLPCEETMFEHVFKLLGGHCFTYENGSLTVEKYHQIEYRIDETKSLEEWVDTIEKTFEDSVLAHRVSDVEVGTFLSSGIDSSYVANEVNKSYHVKAFSVGYKEEKYSELSYAEEFAQSIDLDIHTKKVSADEFFEIAPKIQYYMDEPLPNPSALPLYFVANTAAKQVKVVLSGEGADELFGGYNYYTEPLDYASYQKLPQWLRSFAAAVAGKLPSFHGKRFLTRASQPIETRFIRNNYVFDQKERQKVLAQPVTAPDPAQFTKPYFDQAAKLDDVSKMQYVDIHTWMLYDILLKADKMSMANSLELRVPFLDKKMLEVAMQIPAKYRVSREMTKIALRKAAIRQLPPKTANKKKLGFPVPLNDWLKQEPYYRQVAEAFQSEEAKLFFDQAYIMKLLQDHKDGKRGNMKKIWSVYCFLLWYREYFINR